MPIDKNILRDYIATANSGKYGTIEEVNSKFPELKDYDTQLLKDYLATANSGKYSTLDEVNGKFPEFFQEGQKKKPIQPPMVGGLKYGESGFGDWRFSESTSGLASGSTKTTTPSVSTKGAPKTFQEGVQAVIAKQEEPTNLDFKRKELELWKGVESQMQTRVNKLREAKQIEQTLEVEIMPQIEALKGVVQNTSLPMRERQLAQDNYNQLVTQAQELQAAGNKAVFDRNAEADRTRQTIAEIDLNERLRQSKLQKDYNPVQTLVDGTLANSIRLLNGIREQAAIVGLAAGGQVNMIPLVSAQSDEMSEKVREFADSLITQEAPASFSSFFDGDNSPKEIAAFAANAIASTVPTVAAGLLGGAPAAIAAGAGLMYEESYEAMKDAGLSGMEAKAAAFGIGVPLGLLDAYGVSDIINAVGGKRIIGEIARDLAPQIAGKNLTKEQIFQAAKKSFGEKLKGFSSDLYQVAKKEPVTEMQQALVSEGGKQLAEAYTGKDSDMVVDPQTGVKRPMTSFEYAEGLAENVATEGLGGLVGGVTLGSIPAAYKAINSPSAYKLAMGLRGEAFEDFLEDLDVEVESGILSREEANQAITNVLAIQEASKLIPKSYNLGEDAVVEATNLLIEKKGLEKSIEGADPAMSAPIKEQIKALDERLINLSTFALTGTAPMSVTDVKPSAEDVAANDLANEGVTEGATEQVKSNIVAVAQETLAKSLPIVQGVLGRMNNAEYINDNDIKAAEDEIYGILDEVDKREDLSPEQKSSVFNLIEPLLNNISNYEFRTKTETVKTTEKRPIESARGDKAPTTFFTPAEGAEVELTLPNGDVRRGTLSNLGGEVVISGGGKQIRLGVPEVSGRGITLDETTSKVIENPALSDVKTTTVALNSVEDIIKIIEDKTGVKFKDANQISNEYHKAKNNQRNPSLVSAINELFPSEEIEEGGIVLDPETGNIASVTVVLENGSKLKVTSPEQALDLAIRIRAQEVGEVPPQIMDEVMKQYEDVEVETTVETPYIKESTPTQEVGEVVSSGTSPQVEVGGENVKFIDEKTGQNDTTSGINEPVTPPIAPDGVQSQVTPLPGEGESQATALPAEQAKSLANKIRSLKSGGGRAYDASIGLPIAIYDFAIETVAKAIEGGATIVDAVEQALAYIKENYKDSFNEDAFVEKAFRAEKDSIIERAKQDGTYMLAPNGNKTNLNEEQWASVRTTPFKKWFGDWQNDAENSSKVVDENGEPLVVYHGSVSGDIDEFNREKIKRKPSGLKEFGTYFTTNKKLANFYKEKAQLTDEAKSEINNRINKLNDLLVKSRSNKEYNEISSEINRLNTIKSGKVYAVFLNLKKIKEFDAKGKEEMSAWRELEVDAGYKIASNRDAMEFLKEGRFGVEKVDGVKAKNIVDAFVQGDEKLAKELIGDVYLVFDGDPSRIKSATENVGEFSPLNNDIRDLSAKVRSFKSKNRGMYDATIALPLFVYDGFLEVVARAIERGLIPSEIIREGLAYLDRKRAEGAIPRVPRKEATLLLARVGVYENNNTRAEAFGFKAPRHAVNAAVKYLGADPDTTFDMLSQEDLEKLKEIRDNNAKVPDVRKLISKALSRRFPNNAARVRAFLKIDPKKLGTLTDKYVEAVNDLLKAVPSFTKMNQMFDEVIASAQRVVAESDPIRTLENARKNWQKILDETNITKFEHFVAFTRRAGVLATQLDKLKTMYSDNQEVLDEIEQIERELYGEENRYAERFSAQIEAFKQETASNIKSLSRDVAENGSEDAKSLIKVLDTLSAQELAKAKTTDLAMLEDAMFEAASANENFAALQIINKIAADRNSPLIIDELSKTKNRVKNKTKSQILNSLLTRELFNMYNVLGLSRDSKFNTRLIKPLRNLFETVNNSIKEDTKFMSESMKKLGRGAKRKLSSNKVGIIFRYLDTKFGGSHDWLGLLLGNENALQAFMEDPDYKSYLPKNKEFSSIEDVKQYFVDQNKAMFDIKGSDSKRKNVEAVYKELLSKYGENGYVSKAKIAEAFANDQNNMFTPSELSLVKAWEQKSSQLLERTKVIASILGIELEAVENYIARQRMSSTDPDSSAVSMDSLFNWRNRYKKSADSTNQRKADFIGAVETDAERLIAKNIKEINTSYGFAVNESYINRVINNIKNSSLPSPVGEAIKERVSYSNEAEFGKTKQEEWAVTSFVKRLFIMQILVGFAKPISEFIASPFTLARLGSSGYKAVLSNVISKIASPLKSNSENIKNLQKVLGSSFLNDPFLVADFESGQNPLLQKSKYQKLQNWALKYSAGISEVILKATWYPVFKVNFEAATGNEFSFELFNNAAWRADNMLALQDASATTDIQIAEITGSDLKGDKKKYAAFSGRTTFGRIDVTGSVGSVITFMTNYPYRQYKQVRDAFFNSQGVMDSTVKLSGVFLENTMYAAAASVISPIVKYLIASLSDNDEEKEKAGNLLDERIKEISGSLSVFNFSSQQMLQLAVSPSGVLGRGVIILGGMFGMTWKQAELDYLKGKLEGKTLSGMRMVNNPQERKTIYDEIKKIDAEMLKIKDVFYKEYFVTIEPLNTTKGSFESGKTLVRLIPTLSAVLDILGDFNDPASIPKLANVLQKVEDTGWNSLTDAEKSALIVGGLYQAAQLSSMASSGYRLPASAEIERFVNFYVEDGFDTAKERQYEEKEVAGKKKLRDQEKEWIDKTLSE